MRIREYFSRDPNKRAKYIFNLIAPVYGKVDAGLINNYINSIDIVDSEIGIGGKHVLDIGTGTGAWAAMFDVKGAKKVHGIDLAKKMIEQGKANHPELSFSVANGENLTHFPDNSFDIVTASFVLHGVKIDRRRKILEEMKRISREHIVVHDFSGSTPLFIRFLELLERSDYKNFKTGFCNELKNMFSKVKKIETDNSNGLYFASIIHDE